ncbi:hypothetical protein H0H81_010967 [Sphagnurus paluster]|uniref:EVE domain-containing protein n=1 Tax=Sphagnurus paluster TaxID=117069 RepID=A0A9P7FR82_9AGAR|nr:hypothetical protein H0H81_010967 [Sphagnurus paluster]
MSSVDDFESVKTSAWEGVRNYEARNLMKEMKEGEKVRVPSTSLKSKTDDSVFFRHYFIILTAKRPV